jgi:hypothetical protein
MTMTRNLAAVPDDFVPHGVKTYGAAAQSGAVHVSEPYNPGNVVPFSPKGARMHTDKVLWSLETAYDGVIEAYDRQAWKVCPRAEEPDVNGYPSWGEYLRAEFGSLRVIKVSDEQAETLIQVCREQDLSYRQIATLLGKSTGYVHAHDPTKGTEGVTVGEDGRRRQKSTGLGVADDTGDDTENVTDLSKHYLIERVVAFVRSRGDEGCTSADVKKAFPGKGHQRISAALSRATHPSSRRLRYDAPEVRGQFGRYFAVECTEDAS